MGLGFIHPAFLAAGAAVAVPVLIHLLFRQRARPIDIGTLQFLRVALRDRARRRRIRHWSLLVLRSAGVLLMALLFARPYGTDRGEPGRAHEVVLLIDRSASMAAAAADASPFDKARRQAGEVLRSLPDGTAIHLAYFDANGVAPVREPRIEPGARPGLSGTDYTRASAGRRDIMVGSRRLDRRVLLWTDLQRCGLGAPAAAPFPPGVDVAIIDVGRPLTRNLAVEDVQAERTDLRDRQPVSVAARVFNAGLFPARDVRVTIALEGVPAIVQTVNVAGHERRLVRFEVPIGQPGLYHGSVAVAAGDDLPFDDRRWLAFAARRPDRVLLVDGEPGPSVFGNETYFLEMALRLGRPGEDPDASPTPYRPERLAWDGRSGSLPRLDPFGVVVLCNVPDLSPADADALARFVRSGGCAIIFTGDQVEAGAYAAAEKSGLVPGRLEGTAEDGPYHFAGWEKEHPLLAPFADPQHGDLRTLRFRKITRIVPDASSRVLATAQGGSPLLVERARVPASACCSRSRPTTPGASGLSAACICRSSIRRWATRPAGCTRSVPCDRRLPARARGRFPGSSWRTGMPWSATWTPPNPRSNGRRLRRCARRTGSPRRSPIHRAGRGRARRRQPVRNDRTSSGDRSRGDS